MYKHGLCTFPTFKLLLHPLLHPQIFVLDVRSCDALPVAPGPWSAAQIFELRCSQVDLARCLELPRALIGCLWQARAFRRAALSASCASLHLVSGGFENRQPHERGLRFPHRQRQTLAQDLCCAELFMGEIKVLWWTGLVGFFKVTEEKFNLYFQKISARLYPNTATYFFHPVPFIGKQY